MAIGPPNYTGNLLAVFTTPQAFEPSIVASMEASQPRGTPMCLQVDLSSRPTNLEETVSHLSQMLKDAGVHSWATEPAFADPVSPCFYVTWVNEGNGNVVASTWQQFLLSTPGLVLIGLIVIMFLWLFFPGFAEMVQMIMAMGFMFIMMYFMTQMMAAVYPAMKPTAEKEKELIRQAKAGSSKALAELKSLAEKGVSWAEKAWEEITR